MNTSAIPSENLPRHVAIIMDGNGRWARQQGRSRSYGHIAGAEAVKPIIIEAVERRIEAVTLYSFSMENWKRPDNEVATLMELYAHHLAKERALIMDNNVRFMHFGRREGLPQGLLDELDEAMDYSKDNTGLTLALALNYGGRTEIADAIRRIAEAAQSGRLDPRQIDESTIDAHLYTAGLPDPDLLIRTAGERRLSNFLLWQISYAELWVTDTLWPDFTVEHFRDALHDFASRQRRFGDVVNTD